MTYSVLGRVLSTDRLTMSILLVLVDFGVGLEMQEALDLHENLYKFCVQKLELDQV